VAVGACTTTAKAQLVPRLDAGAGAAAWSGRWEPRLALDGELAWTPMGQIAASARSSVARFTWPNGSPGSEAALGGTLSTAVRGTTVWLGADMMRRNGWRDTVEQPRFSAGGSHRWGDFTLSVSSTRRAARLARVAHFSRSVDVVSVRVDSVSAAVDTVITARTVADSARVSASRRWSDLQAALTWDRRRWTAWVALGGRRTSRGVSGLLWSSAELAVMLSRPVSLVVGASTARGERFLFDAEHRRVTVGLRIAPSPPRRPAPAPRRGGVAESFIVMPIGDGRFRCTMRVPRARRVELSGDFNGWRTLAFERVGQDLWTLTLPLAPGIHRLDIRIDDGPWVAPPGLVTVTDDYAGEVGLLVIESPSGADSQ
jgi:hypothetical protein